MNNRYGSLCEINTESQKKGKCKFISIYKKTFKETKSKNELQGSKADKKLYIERLSSFLFCQLLPE